MQNIQDKQDKKQPSGDAWKDLAATQSAHELSQGHTFWLWSYRIGIVGSFTALMMFIVERMAGTDANVLDYTGAQYINGGIGVVFAFAFSAFVYGFYLADYSVKQRLFMFLIVVSFPLYSEVAQTMNRAEEMVTVKSLASPEFLAAQKALDVMTGTVNAPLNSAEIASAQGDKAAHEAELGACTRYPALARVQRCQRYEKAKIAAAEGRISGYSSVASSTAAANHAQVQQTIRTIGELGKNEEHAHPMVRMLASLGMSGLAASLFMAILIIGSIETALAWLGSQVKDYQKAMRARGLEIGNQRREVVRFSHQATTNAQATTSPGHTGDNQHPALAPTAELKAPAQVDGPAEIKWLNSGIRQTPEQLQRVYELAAMPGETFREAARAGKDAADEAVEEGKQPFGFSQGVLAESSAERNRRERVELETNHQVLVSDAVKVLGSDPVRRVAETGTQGVNVPASLYADWVVALRAGECKESVTESRKWVQKRIASNQLDQQTYNPREIASIVAVFFMRALHDRVVVENPNHKNGNAKYFMV